MCIRRSNRLKHSFQTFPEARVRYPQSSLSTLEIYDKQFRSQYEISNKRMTQDLNASKCITLYSNGIMNTLWTENSCLGVMPFMMVSITGILFNVSISITIFQYVCRKQLTHVLRGIQFSFVIIDQMKYEWLVL